MARPLKMIQGYLLTNEATSLVHTVGVALSDTAALQGSRMIKQVRQAPDEGEAIAEAEIGLDPQTLRMTAHMAILLRILRQEEERLEGNELDIEENVLVAYIQTLRAAGKRDLIPLYASRLQHDRYVEALAQILPDISHPAEQREILELLHRYDLDVVNILCKYHDCVAEAQLGTDEAVHPLHILEETEEQKLWPAQRIRLEFLPDEFNEDDDAVVQCLHWFQLLKGRWNTTFEALSTMLRRCLGMINVACAFE